MVFDVNVIQRLANLGIVDYNKGSISYSGRFTDRREELMSDPETQSMFEESMSERCITDEKEKMYELFTLVSLRSLMEFVGGALKDEEIDTFMQYICTMDRIKIEGYYDKMG